MKEIKFRAWDIKNKLMFPVWSIDFGTSAFDTKFQPQTVLLKVGHELKRTNFELMQYTGLKDKKGVEIYEGDICKVDNIENFEVIWRGIGFWFKRTDEKCFVFTPFDYWIEVIGNIYENPELLEVKNENRIK